MTAPSNFIQPPCHTLRFRYLRPLDLRDGELVLTSGDATENRGQLPFWTDIARDSASRVRFISAVDKEHVVIRMGEHTTTLNLLDEEGLERLLGHSRVLIDVSGLPHHVWAPILKAAFSLRVSTRVLYAEPEGYREHPSPASATMFDLSVEFEGLAPLSGFARLKGPVDEANCIFVALLGFEGNRPERLLLQIEPTPKVVPVVGVPGFRIEFPAFTIACNRVFLEQYRAQFEVRYARASCPFEAYSAIAQIGRDNPGHYMYLAPVGTKPHAIGAVLYAIAHPTSTEIMFDHPVRKAGRTKGVGLLHVYDFEEFDEFRT